MLVARWCSLALVLALASCDPVTGVTTGTTFDVRAVQMVNGCGTQAVAAAPVLQFQVAFSITNGMSVWSVPANGAMAQGTWDPSTQSFQIQADAYAQLSAGDRATGTPACVIRRIDVIQGIVSGVIPTHGDAGATDALDATPDASQTVSADAAPPSFTATETITYGPVMGADCANQIGASNGQFNALPCQLTYAMTATQSADAGVAH